MSHEFKIHRSAEKAHRQHAAANAKLTEQTAAHRTRQPASDLPFPLKRAAHLITAAIMHRISADTLRREVSVIPPLLTRDPASLHTMCHVRVLEDYEAAKQRYGQALVILHRLEKATPGKARDTPQFIWQGANTQTGSTFRQRTPTRRLRAHQRVVGSCNT